MRTRRGWAGGGWWLGFLVGVVFEPVGWALEAPGENGALVSFGIVYLLLGEVSRARKIRPAKVRASEVCL